MREDLLLWLIVVNWRGKYAKLVGNLRAAREKCAVFHGWIAEQSRMERGPIRTANGEHWGERGDLGGSGEKKLAAPAAPL